MMQPLSYELTNKLYCCGFLFLIFFLFIFGNKIDFMLRICPHLIKGLMAIFFAISAPPSSVIEGRVSLYSGLIRVVSCYDVVMMLQHLNRQEIPISTQQSVQARQINRNEIAVLTKKDSVSCSGIKFFFN